MTNFAVFDVFLGKYVTFESTVSNIVLLLGEKKMV